jgi:hypothetical protein
LDPAAIEAIADYETSEVLAHAHIDFIGRPQLRRFEQLSKELDTLS